MSGVLAFLKGMLNYVIKNPIYALLIASLILNIILGWLTNGRKRKINALRKQIAGTGVQTNIYIKIIESQEKLGKINKKLEQKRESLTIKEKDNTKSRLKDLLKNRLKKEVDKLVKKKNTIEGKISKLKANLHSKN